MNLRDELHDSEALLPDDAPGVEQAFRAAPSGRPLAGRRWGFRHRRHIAYYLVWLVALFAAAAGIGVWYGHLVAARAADTEGRSQARFAAVQAASEIQTGLSRLASEVAQLAVVPGLSDAFKTGCSLSFAGVGPFPEGHLDVLRPDGSVACSSDARAVGRHYGGVPSLQLAPTRPIVEGPVLDTLNSQWVMLELAPIPGGGFAAGFVDLQALGPALASDFGGTAPFEVVVTSADGSHILSRSIDPVKWVEVPAAGTPFGKVGALPHRDVDGRARIYEDSSVTGTNWRVYIGVDRSEVMESANDLFRSQLEIILGGLALVIWTAVILRRRITKPIAQLATWTRTRTSKPDHAPVVETGPAEIADLAAAFNELVLSAEGELTKRARAEEAARAAELSYRRLFDHNPQPMWVYDWSTLNFLAVNDAAVAHYGYSRDEFIRMTIKDICPPDDVPGVVASSASPTIVESAGPWRHVTKDGSVIEVEITSHSIRFAGRVARCVTALDVTERRRHEQQLRELAVRDSLTGLPNRTLVHDRLEKALARTGADGGSVGLLIVDVDRFRLISQAHGGDIGDRLLEGVAQRLVTTGSANQTTGRMGEDEFAIIIDGAISIRDVVGLAECIQLAWHEPFVLDGQEIVITSSIGIEMSDGHRDADGMLRDATAAMHRAKTLGGGRYEMFDSAILEHGRNQIFIESGLRQALELGGLVLHYQPVVEIASGKRVGVEALMRWLHPKLGLLPPGEFIPVAEQTGLITALGRWAIRSACQQAAEWQGQPGLPQRVSVNVAARQLAQSDLATEVSNALAEAHLDPRALCLELTETALMSDLSASLRILHAIHETGVKLSVDDFGTGYSSLLYLRQFPIDYLKIDRAFVSDVATNSVDAAIVAGVISLGHELGISIVAEGVETREQAGVLEAMGCDLGQGYLWSPAVEAKALSARLRPAAGPVLGRTADAHHRAEPRREGLHSNGGARMGGVDHEPVA